LDPSRLKTFSIFEDLPDDDLRTVATLAQEVSVEEGRMLAQEGDYSYEFMAIEEGTAEVRRGDEHIADLGPGDFFGEIGVIEKERRTATVIAKTPMRLITLSGWDLRRIEKAAPGAMEKIRNTLAERRARD
jgi:CRP/FNR family transcriptional regulator, cyclic AMP receptor protein